MSNRTHKEPREDAAMKRRVYLRKKAKVIIPAMIAGSIGIVLVICVLRLSLLPKTMSNSQFALFVLLLVLTVPCTFILIFCEKKALSMPYVPPVAEQVADLPSDEILLRGSDQPVAGPGELLRPAHEGTETASEELLRADQRRA